MAKKSRTRKQAPPRTSAAPEESAQESSESAESELSVGDLVAGLAGDDISQDEPAPAEASEPEPVNEGPSIRLVHSLPIDPDDDLSEVEGEASPRLVSIIESLLFASNKPLRVKQIRKVLEDPPVRQIQLALKHLITTSEERGVVVAQVAGGFVLQTNAHNALWVQKLLQAKPVRLSRPQLETLAVIAYRQPITRPEIDHVRGVDSGAVLKLLLERDLIQIVGKRDDPGRPMLYGTTVHFLEFFNLMSLRDLPDLREFRELSDETKATLRRDMEESEIEVLGQEVLDFARRDGAEPQNESERDDEDAQDEFDAEDLASADSASAEPEPDDESEAESP